VVVQDGLEAGEESGDRQRHKEMREHLADFAIEGTLATDPVERLSDGEVTRTVRWRRVYRVLCFTMFVIECTVSTLCIFGVGFMHGLLTLRCLHHCASTLYPFHWTACARGPGACGVETPSHHLAGRAHECMSGPKHVGPEAKNT
jgi:hypothetical protein